MRAKILRAGGWTMTAYGFTQGTRLLSSLIMTRLLVPEVFGIMAIAMVIIAALALFSDVGLLQSVVRSKRGDDRRFLDTLWAIQIMRGLAIWGTALLVAGALALAQGLGWLSGPSTYAHPLLPYAVGAVGFTAVLAGLESTKVAVARRELELARLSQLEIIGNVIAVATNVGWALVDPSIWAPIGGWLVAAAARTAMTHWFLPGPNNRLHWDPTAVREVVDFGKWVLASSGLTFLVTSGDRLVLGGVLTSEELGIYSIAYLMVNAVQQGLGRLTGYVVFPLLSKVVREEPEQLQRSYYKARFPIDMAALGASGALFAAGDLVIRTLYDTRYAGAGPMLSLLALALIACRYDVSEQVFLALGKPRLLATLNAFRVVTIFLLIPLAYKLGGLHGAILGIVAATLLPTVGTILFSRENGIFDWRRELSRLYAFPAGYLIGEGVRWLWPH